jgi:hypothetical protein
MTSNSVTSDNDHIDFIARTLDSCETNDRNTRVKHCIALYDYLLKELDFVKKHRRFKKIAIDKAYYLMSRVGDVPEMIQSIENFLRAIGALHKVEDEHHESQQAHREHLERSLLMKKLFEKEKLVFTPDIMYIYYNSEVQTVNVNRYKKMMLFINAYKDIDGETNYL